MSNQPDEPKAKWHFKQAQLWRFRNGELLRIELVEVATVECFIQRDSDSLPYTFVILSKGDLIILLSNGGAVLVGSVDERIAELEAANHELAESLLVMSEKYQQVAAERSRLVGEVERLTAIGNEAVLARDRYYGEVVNRQAKIAEYERATSSLQTYDDVVMTACRLLHQSTDSSHITAEDEAADALACCWQEIKALIIKLGQQRNAAGEAVKSACIEYLDSRGQSSLASGMNRAIDIAAICGVQEKD